MDENTEQQINELLRLRETHQRTLHHLEMQWAKQTSSTPPHVLSDIERARYEIGRIDDRIGKLQSQVSIYYSKEVWVKENASETDKLFVVYREMQRLEKVFTSEVRAIHLLINKQDEEDKVDRLKRRIETDRYYYAILFLLTLILILLILVVLSST